MSTKPTEGVTRCDCGSKYWSAETYRILHFNYSRHDYSSDQKPMTWSTRVTYRCASCGDTYNEGAK